jgi:membrane protease YdiL (CAAX protease family)
MSGTRRANEVSVKVIVFLSIIALLAVLSGYLQPRQTDEGAAAHIFQLCILALVPLISIFLATVDRKQPLEIARRLSIPVSAFVLAFGALYYLEHYR